MKHLKSVSDVNKSNVLNRSSMTLDELMSMQQAFDVDHFAGAIDHEGKRRHIAFHVGILAGKLFRIEERADHGEVGDEIYSALIEEVIPDLLVYASQLAIITDSRLDEVYAARLERLRQCHDPNRALLESESPKVT